MHRTSVFASLALTLAVTFASCSTAPSPLADTGPPGPRFLSRHHDLLESLVGSFDLAGWTQVDPFGARLDFVGTADGRLVLDGLFVELTIRGRLGDEDYEAVRFLGYDSSRDVYQATGITSWDAAIPGPARGRFDPETGTLKLRESTPPAVAGSNRGGESVLTFVEDGVWMLDRFVLDWEPRRWSNIRGTRRTEPMGAETLVPEGAEAIQASSTRSE